MIVVAGATGKTGRQVAQALLANGRRVRVLVRSADAAERWRARGAEAHIGDLTQQAELESALADAQAFYALLPEEPARADLPVHRRRMADSLAHAARHVPHVVMLSALPAALSGGNGPAAELGYAESALRAATRTLTVLRPCSFQENVLLALPMCLRNGVYPSLTASSPMVATRDVAALATRCLLEPPARGELIDLIGPVYDAEQVGAALSLMLGRALRVVEVPAEARVEALVGAGMPRAFAEAVAELHASFESGRVRPSGDRMVTGTTTLEQTLASMKGRA